MAALALALESELAPTAALQLSRALEIIRRSPNFSPPQRAAAKMQVARLGWAFVTEARKAKGGAVISPNLPLHRWFYRVEIRLGATVAPLISLNRGDPAGPDLPRR